jgi:hypothetical protein
MDTKNESREPARIALARDPLSAEDILADFYRPTVPRPLARPEAKAPGRPAKKGKAAPIAEERPRPTHYKVVCISLYNEDIERLESLVKELKRRGHSKANKSQVIREALLQIDLDRVPRQH